MYKPKPMTELNELKAKYPLAVEALKGKNFDLTISKYRTIITNEADIKIQVHSISQKTKDQMGKMLAELLNLIAKP